MKKTVKCVVCERLIKDGETVVYRHGDLFHARCRDIPSPPMKAKNGPQRRRPPRSGS